MSLYTDRFSTDWDDIGREEAVERAFALGVAASLGERHPDELAAVRETTGSSYDASIVELAYEEGKRKAAKRERQAGPSTDASEVWEAVISEELDDADRPEAGAGGRDEEDTDRPTDLPSVLADVEATRFPDREPTQADFPEFLE